MRIVYLLLLPLISLQLVACPKNSPVTISESEVEQARALFTRHLQAIGATNDGIPHTAIKMTGSMEYMGEPGRNNFTIEQNSESILHSDFIGGDWCL